MLWLGGFNLRALPKHDMKAHPELGILPFRDDRVGLGGLSDILEKAAHGRKKNAMYQQHRARVQVLQHERGVLFCRFGCMLCEIHEGQLQSRGPNTERSKISPRVGYEN
jgi:hypothetical protein